MLLNFNLYLLKHARLAPTIFSANPPARAKKVNKKSKFNFQRQIKICVTLYNLIMDKENQWSEISKDVADIAKKVNLK